ncbi:MAG: hypothetical protein QOG53_5, partial [Frankiales bacterium]|nr:hypothetical protein [Frankiales bacterium]
SAVLRPIEFSHLLTAHLRNGVRAEIERLDGSVL